MEFKCWKFIISQCARFHSLFFFIYEIWRLCGRVLTQSKPPEMFIFDILLQLLCTQDMKTKISSCYWTIYHIHTSQNVTCFYEKCATLRCKIYLLRKMYSITFNQIFSVKSFHIQSLFTAFFSLLFWEMWQSYYKNIKVIWKNEVQRNTIYGRKWLFRWEHSKLDIKWKMEKLKKRKSNLLYISPLWSFFFLNWI